MRKPLVVLAALLGVLGLFAGCDADTGPPPLSGRPDQGLRQVDIDARLVGLVTEDGCDPLLSWFKTEASSFVDRWGYVGDVVALEATAGAADSAAAGSDEKAAAPPAPTAGGAATQRSAVAGVDYSATNVQEEGIDEPDLVKTDGHRLVTIAGGHLRVVDVDGDKPVLKASLPLGSVAAQDLLLAGDRVLLFGSEMVAYGQPMPVEPTAVDEVGGVGGVRSSPIAPPPGRSFVPRTMVMVVDVSDASAPKIVSTVTMDGSYVAARLVDGVARVVLRSSPSWMQRAIDEPTIKSSTIDEWLPSYTYAEPGRDDAKVEGRLVQCAAVHHPVEFAGPETVTVVAIDPDDPRPGNAASITGAGDTVYASAERLYVSSMRWGGVVAPATDDVTSDVVTPQAPTTQLHAFDISDEVTTKYVGSGAVEGTLLNQFSLSEYEGDLRVATTKSDPTSGRTESQVVVLRMKDGSLSPVGAVGGLGVTERLYAVRFIGPIGYVVTFRQTDPLYVLDLSDPAAPVLKGELKIPGFSSYLHPIGDGRLLGIGQNATEEGRRLGTQLSLFDVSDVSAPKRLSTFDLGGFGSEAEYDHHAFLWWARTRLAVVPVASGGAIGVTVSGDSLGEEGRVSHPTPFPIRRSLVVGDSLLTLSDNGLLSSRLADGLPQEAWLAF